MSRCAASDPGNDKSRRKLLEQISTLVEDLRQLKQEKAIQPYYRQLICLARTAQLTEAAFRPLLNTGTLKPGRITNLINILNCAAASAAFTREVAPISYREALRLAQRETRGQWCSPRQDPDFPAALAKWVAKLMNPILTTTAWEEKCGLFLLRFHPAPRKPSGAPFRPQGCGATPLSLFLSADTAERLQELAGQSGLNQAQTAAELLSRAPWDELHTLL